MKGQKTYDVQCAVLAEHFLQDHPHRKSGDVAGLAGEIQEAIETYMREVEARANAPATGGHS